MSFRDGPFNDLKVPLTWTAAVAVIVAVVVGVALLLSDRRETLQTAAYGMGHRAFDMVDKPVAGVLSAPSRWARVASEYVGDYLFAAAENHRLRREVAELKQWRDLAVALQDTNRRYQAILGLKTDPPIPMVTARVVLDSRGPFANTRLADAGVEKGVKVGNPVMSDRGLVGRVVGVAPGVSRILLLTDVASRTPVLVARTDARAILLGDGGANPRLGYLRGQDPVHEGDRILTSGDGGVFPRGLPVGVAAKGLDGQWRVRLDADLAAIDFVRILQFQDFAALADETALDKPALPPLPPGTMVPPPSSGAAPSSAPAKTAEPTKTTLGKPESAPAKAKPPAHSMGAGLAAKLAALLPGHRTAPAAPKPVAPNPAVARPATLAPARPAAGARTPAPAKALSAERTATRPAHALAHKALTSSRTLRSVMPLAKPGTRPATRAPAKAAARPPGRGLEPPL